MAYRSINVYRSMLSGTLEQMEGYDIDEHPLLIKLMQGIFNSTPPKPKYTGFWDVDVFLRHLKAQELDVDLSLTSLSHKLVVLSALTSLFRVSEISTIDSESMVFSGPVMKFALLKLRKNQRKSKRVLNLSAKVYFTGPRFSKLLLNLYLTKLVFIFLFFNFILLRIRSNCCKLEVF